MRNLLISSAALLALAASPTLAAPRSVALPSADAAVSPGHQHYKNASGHGVESPRERERERGTAQVQHPDESTTGRM